MKKSKVFLSLLSVIFISSAALAAEHDHSAEAGEDKEGEAPGMMDKMKMMKGKGGMMGDRPTLVATSDGGIVILQGPKLIKYDAQLNLIKEVEMKMGPKHMKKGGAAEATNSGPQPMNDEEIAAMLGEEPAA